MVFVHVTQDKSFLAHDESLLLSLLHLEVINLDILIWIKDSCRSVVLYLVEMLFVQGDAPLLLLLFFLFGGQKWH